MRPACGRRRRQRRRKSSQGVHCPAPRHQCFFDREISRSPGRRRVPQGRGCRSDGQFFRQHAPTSVSPRQACPCTRHRCPSGRQISSSEGEIYARQGLSRGRGRRAAAPSRQRRVEVRDDRTPGGFEAAADVRPSGDKQRRGATTRAGSKRPPTDQAAFGPKQLPMHLTSCRPVIPLHPAGRASNRASPCSRDAHFLPA